MQVQRLHPLAKVPVRRTANAAGYDLFPVQPVQVPAGKRVEVHTGIAIAIPEGCYGRIAPRSSLALKNWIDVAAGVIDPDYRGQVVVVLHNHSSVEYVLSNDTACAQLILEKIETPPVMEVETLPETVRGAGGFGSTDVKTSN